jgi:hypothetical protein
MSDKPLMLASSRVDSSVVLCAADPRPRELGHRRKIFLLYVRGTEAPAAVFRQSFVLLHRAHRSCILTTRGVSRNALALALSNVDISRCCSCKDSTTTRTFRLGHDT